MFYLIFIRQYKIEVTFDNITYRDSNPLSRSKVAHSTSVLLVISETLNVIDIKGKNAYQYKVDCR